MKNYTLQTEMTFGKYKGKTIDEILAIETGYINWCLINLDHFYISDSVIKEINNSFPNFRTGQLAEEKRTEKKQKGRNETSFHFGSDYYEERPTYREYNGSYAQDVAGFSDEDIDNIFDGDPDMYWNID